MKLKLATQIIILKSKHSNMMWSKLIIYDIHWGIVVEKYWKPLFSVIENLRSSKSRKLCMYLKSPLLCDAQWFWIWAEVFQAAFIIIVKCCGICCTKQECCVQNKGCSKNIMMQYRWSLPRTLLIHLHAGIWVNFQSMHVQKPFTVAKFFVFS